MLQEKYFLPISSIGTWTDVPDMKGEPASATALSAPSPVLAETSLPLFGAIVSVPWLELPEPPPMAAPAALIAVTLPPVIFTVPPVP